MTPLAQFIQREISENGAMPLDRFMSLALCHADYGYYMNRDPLGEAGDFITAPEISQIFGELIGLWCFGQIQDKALMDSVHFAELGAGRGSLMADLLRALASVTGRKDWPLHLIEISPTLRALQQKTLENYAPIHHGDLTQLPPQPIIFIANEFFDALPIRQFEYRGGAWLERFVINSDSGFAIDLAPPQEPDSLDFLDSLDVSDISDGTVAEFSPALGDNITRISRHIRRYGGALLAIDYGKDTPFGDSLQAVQNHCPVDCLTNPGLADLSAWVDFGAIKRHALANDCQFFGTIGQGDFLKSLGLYERAEQLGANATPEIRRDLAAAVDRLASPAHMGSVFKAAYILPPASG